MKNKLQLLFLVLLFANSYAQNEIWRPTTEEKLSSAIKMERASNPREFKLFSLNLNALKTQLANAPLDSQNIESTLIVTFPNPKGELIQYRVYEAPVMEAGLAEKFPDIKSYSGRNIKNSAETIRFSVTLFGLHLMSFNSDSGTHYIDTYTKDLSNYIIYRKQDISPSRTFTCEVESDETIQRVGDMNSLNPSVMVNDGNFRTYRLAMACTIEYAAYHVNAAGLNAGTLAQKKAAVLAAMVVTMTRVNGVFEIDMSLRMNLIANNDLIIFITSDSFNNTNANTLINQSQTVIDATIGAANYDIGHTVSTGGGGLAQLFSPCTGNKARGITGSAAPVGDAYDIDYVAHEMGHQWGANHTQNNNCNRNAGTAVEPGSASTIMGYAGICAPNVQNNSDDHFHGVSITEMTNFILGTGGTCAVTVANGNFAPVVNAGPNYTIPRGTAFILKGNATDANSDALTYCWEQTNTEVSTQPPVNTSTGGPNFRSNPPSSSPDRYMPPLASVVAGNLAPTWEVVPNVARTMNFALTVRDNRTPNGGQTGRDDTVITVASVGPFLVTSPNTAVSYVAGTNQTVTWDVAGTTANGINCANIDIFLSTDGGLTFPTLLASNVPNDGLEVVTIPNTVGTTNRIMVIGNNHIFYDVSNANFTITAPPSSFALAFSGIENGQNKEACQGTSVSYDMNYTSLTGFSGTTTFTVTGNPVGTVATFSPSSTNTSGIVSLAISNTTSATPGFYTLVVTGTSGATTRTVNLYLNLLNSSFATMSLTSPTNLAFAQATSVTLTWANDPSATLYDVQIATSEDFSTIIQSATVATNSYLVSGLSQLTNYFWRVLPRNTSCLGTYSLPFRFTTGQQTCTNFSSTNVPLAISASGTPTVNSTLTIPSGSNVSISDINVSVQLTHTWTEDLVLTLISPSGTQIQLVNAQCADNDNINATFDDSGVTLVCGTNPAISGTIRPTQLLSTLNGQNSQGVWTLRINDIATGDGGSLTAWSLNVCNVPNVPITCGQISTTWNGTTWSNGKPLDNVAATINGNYTSFEDVHACSLNVTGTSQVILSSGNNFFIDGVVNVAPTASFTIQNNANLVQNQNVANSANATVFRNSNPLRRLDYTIWSSPVTGAQTLKQFSPNTLNNRFYNYNTTTNLYNAVANPVTQTFGLGSGYLIRMPDNHPTTPTIWNGQFSGNLNNGNVDVNLAYIGAGQSFNMIGNPYPSTVNADDFITDNLSDIFGTIYFWRKINNAAGTAYATYTLGGATTTSPSSPTPNGIIQVGQGFIVEARNVTNPTASFINAQRVGNNQNQFFRSVSEIEKNRIWVNITNDADLFSQFMVGYMTGATNDYDYGIDGRYVNDSAVSLTSIVNNDEYTIQLKELPFVTTDVIPLNFETDQAGTFTIALDHVDGLFEGGNQAIYLRDNALQTVHELTVDPYNFVSEIGVFASRFEIIFESTLTTPTFPAIENSVIAYAQNEIINVKSSVEELSKIIVYDTLGRLLFASEEINSMNFVIPNLNAPNQALLIDIELKNGQKVTKKIIY
ncbi:MAG: proprotein convertase P-domain-containing protein [Flavobacteriales bacterium]|nr:proprotein convertase P-domain-containing protein [Flavobacteriales bacterium]